MRKTLTSFVAACGLAVLSTGALAQDTPQDPLPATLIADEVFITPERKLIATGNVEAFQGDIRLRAKQITFDNTTGQLEIEGPIRIEQNGDITVLADAAQMDRGLQDGLLTGARVVFQQQLQIASLQMVRVGGRYSQLYKTAATSCHVCEDGKPPLWQIRAQKITHDQLERQLYFENATFRVMDVPVFYFPVLRLPDPTLERANGFLIPSGRITSRLGAGVKIPYFFKLGDSKDLTVAPYISPKTRTLDLRYRQAFRTGRIEFNGAVSDDDLQTDELRGYLFGVGTFDLQNDFRLQFDIKSVSDDAYLIDYGLPDYDRLRSELSLTRVKRDAAFHTALIHYESLRDGESHDQLASRIGDVYYQKRFFPKGIGGEVRLGVNGHGHYRSSKEDIVGRDMRRLTADVDWRRNIVFTSGLRADYNLGFSADFFDVADDSTAPGNVTRTTPRASFRLSYPMTMQSDSATYFLEPVIQAGWAKVSGAEVPNDESRFVEFDQGNLLSLSRFPSVDRREDASTLVAGVNWSRFGRDGWRAQATFGQVFRSEADPDFSRTSGLSGTSSDMLIAGQLLWDQGLSLTARGLLNETFDFSKFEFRGDWNKDRLWLTGSYIWLGIDEQELRDTETSEIWFDSRYQVNTNWTASANLRYDLSDDRATRAGLGVVYQNECVTLDMSVSRRFTSTSSVEPTTDFGFTLALNGFSIDGDTTKYRRSCKNT